jgi:hypothetical protein
MRSAIFATALLLTLPPAEAAAEAMRTGSVGPGPVVPRYDLHVRVDPAAHQLSVDGTVSVPLGTTGDPRILHLSPQMKDVRISEQNPDGTSTQLTPVWTPVEGGGHVFKLPEAPAAGQPLKLRVSYSCTNGNGLVFSLRGPAAFAGGNDFVWYPEFGDEKRGEGTMSFDAPPGVTVVASGARRGTTWTFDISSPLHLSFVAGVFTATEVNGAIPVTVYNLKARADVASYARKAQQDLSILADEFGPFPFRGFSIVEVPQEEANNAGFSGASLEGIILVDNTSFDSGFSVPFYAHELGHQWWGNLVGTSGTAGNDMLDEALAQWGSLTVVEKLEGSEAAERYRRSGYPGYASDQSGEGYFTIAAAGLDHRLSDLPSGFVSHELADSKGFLVYDQLARTIGRDNFIRTLKSISADYAYRDISWAEFLRRLQLNSRKDLSRFFAEWFDRTGAPEFVTKWSQSGHDVMVSVRQTEVIYHFDSEVALTGGGQKSATFPIHIDGGSTQVRLNVPFRVTGVVVDPHFATLHWTDDFKARSQALASVTAASFLESDGKHAEARAAYEKALDTIAQPDIWGVEFRANEGLAVSAALDSKWDQARDYGIKAIEAAVRPPLELPWAYERLAVAARHLGDTSLMRFAVNGAVAADAAIPLPSGAGKTAQALAPAAR